MQIRHDQVIPDCPFCDKPLDQGTGGIVNGLHATCDRQFNEELHAAFPGELSPQEPEFFPIPDQPTLADEALLVF